MWTVVLVLAALGGAGLATAADRLPTDQTRPELTWQADRLVAPRVAAMTSQLTTIDADLEALAGAGREALGRLPALDPAAIETAVADGDAISLRLAAELELLLDMRTDQLETIDDSRLSQANQQLLADIDEALAAIEPLDSTWAEMADAARRVTALLESLFHHDGLVFRATTAGRQADWPRALELLDEAALPLAEAHAIRDALAERADVSTLSALLDRYSDYDAALVALYREIQASGTQDSPEVQALRAEVERTQALLPANNDALRVVVADAAGPAVARGLVDIEQARGLV
ncbi:MAG TPA: hypothetical protein VH741_00090, partial [Candidatus Limnocylindrales bacterium]